MSCEVDDLVMYLIVTRDYKNAIGDSQRVIHEKGLHKTVTFLGGVRRVMVVRSTLKIAKFRRS